EVREFLFNNINIIALDSRAAGAGYTSFKSPVIHTSQWHESQSPVNTALEPATGNSSKYQPSKPRWKFAKLQQVPNKKEVGFLMLVIVVSPACLKVKVQTERVHFPD
ncbi:Hypothetical predicted protein, partial [Pelobates cultripes]